MHSDVQYCLLESQAISPLVLQASLYTEGLHYPEGYALEPRYVTDYELEFYIESRGRMMVEGQLYPISPGDIVFRRPGQWVQGIMPYSCHLVCFDLCGNMTKDPRHYSFTDQRNELQPNYINPFLDRLPIVFHPPNTAFYQQQFESVLREFSQTDEMKMLLLRALVLRLLHAVYTDVTTSLQNHGMVEVNGHYGRIKTALQFIEDNLDKKLCLDSIAAAAGLSPNYFHRIFSETVGCTVNRYTVSRKMEKAKQLLALRDCPIYEVALACGCENVPYFSVVFKKHTDCSPTQFRKKYRQYE